MTAKVQGQSLVPPEAPKEKKVQRPPLETKTDSVAKPVLNQHLITICGDEESFGITEVDKNWIYWNA